MRTWGDGLFRIRAADSSDQDVGTQEENGRCPSTAGQALEFSKAREPRIRSEFPLGLNQYSYSAFSL